MKRLAIFWALSAGCMAQLPEVDPTTFACVDDQPLPGGELPCPESHWCTEDHTAVPPDAGPVGSCTPRLDCSTPRVGAAGCVDDAFAAGDDLGNEPRTRCEPVFTDRVAAVRCESGLHTSTSTTPKDLDVCDCPDGLHCVAFAERNGEDHPLFLLPNGGALPTGSFGIGGEVREWRRCVRACSSEANCSADHTCRPAAVLTPGLVADPAAARFTVGVCYPNLLVSTSSTVELEQPQPLACRKQRDCGGINTRPCQLRVVTVPDHPSVPAGPGWGVHYALSTLCEDAATSSLIDSGRACNQGSQCKTGICLDGRCANPCDPDFEGTQGCFASQCRPQRVTRARLDGTEVVDLVYACAALP